MFEATFYRFASLREVQSHGTRSGGLNCCFDLQKETTWIVVKTYSPNFCGTSSVHISGCTCCTLLYRTPHIIDLTPPPSPLKMVLYCSQSWTHDCPVCMHLAMTVFEVMGGSFFVGLLNPSLLSSPSCEPHIINGCYHMRVLGK